MPKQHSRKGYILVECLVALMLLAATAAVLQLIVNSIAGGMDRAMQKDAALLVAFNAQNGWLASACHSASSPSQQLPVSNGRLTNSITAEATGTERSLAVDVSWNDRLSSQLSDPSQPPSLRTVKQWTHSTATRVLCD